MSKSKGNKTLSDKLAELANPTPQFIDPEDEYNEATNARLEHYDEEYEISSVPAKKAANKKSNLRQTNSELLAASDVRYAGKRVSRKDLEDNSSPQTSAEDESDSDLSDIEAFKSKLTKKEYNEEDESGSDDHAEESGEEDLEMGESEEGEEEEEEEDYDNSAEEGNGIESSEDEDGVERLPKDSRADDVEKGKSIQNQLSFWEHLLECRIKMHKGIQLSNQLHHGPATFKLFKSAAGENFFDAAATGAQKALKTMLDSCMELQELLLKSNSQTKGILKRKLNGATSKIESDEEIPSDTEEDEDDVEKEKEVESASPQRKKMKIADYETEIAERHASFRDFCNRTLHLWNEKTRLASGRTGVAAKTSGFGAFDQSILKQIEGILADKQRLVNRTRIKRSVYRILGTSDQPKSISPDKPALDDVNIENSEVTGAKVIEEEEFDPEIYDDDDFYHQLLRELIEKRTGEGGSNQIALGRQWLEIQKLRSKAKRKVDAKASKGRRLRYQVHPKLVSFMAPYPETSWNDTAKNELFASLFGSSSTVN